MLPSITELYLVATRLLHLPTRLTYLTRAPSFRDLSIAIQCTISSLSSNLQYRVDSFRRGLNRFLAKLVVAGNDASLNAKSGS